MKRLQGKSAIITGGASGMGAAEARAFAAEGAHVTIADIASGEALAEELGARFHPLDVTDADQWQSLVAAAEEAYGSVDILVNNAGIVTWGGVADLDEAAFRRVLEVNTVGTFLGMQAVTPAMERASGGSIINIGSTSAFVGGPRAVAYTASKWAVRGMTKAAALELAPKGIRVNAVHPGVIQTPMSAAAGDRTSGTPPLGRLGTPADVAAVVVHLASDESAFTTGADHVVDGGRIAGHP
ncbi:glucose 1-dehydrogenase [Actinomadura vinacea]|uniref:SDR family NAD(P)-dependent oxidoreductase n=1 Tax=Actinomadura vinacea TaxID=115336 RepID=UPI0031D8A4E9